MHWDLQMELQMDSNLGLMKELSWFIQLAPLKDIKTEILMVHLMGYQWDERMELHWDLHMEL